MTNNQDTPLETRLDQVVMELKRTLDARDFPAQRFSANLRDSENIPVMYRPGTNFEAELKIKRIDEDPASLPKHPCIGGWHDSKVTLSTITTHITYSDTYSERGTLGDVLDSTSSVDYTQTLTRVTLASLGYTSPPYSLSIDPQAEWEALLSPGQFLLLSPSMNQNTSDPFGDCCECEWTFVCKWPDPIICGHRHCLIDTYPTGGFNLDADITLATRFSMQSHKCNPTTFAPDGPGTTPSGDYYIPPDFYWPFNPALGMAISWGGSLGRIGHEPNYTNITYDPGLSDSDIGQYFFNLFSFNPPPGYTVFPKISVDYPPFGISGFGIIDMLDSAISAQPTNPCANDFGGTLSASLSWSINPSPPPGSVGGSGSYSLTITFA